MSGPSPRLTANEMDASLPHTRSQELGGSALRLRVESVRHRLTPDLFVLPRAGTCPGGHCARLTVKSLHRRLAQQASLPGQDPLMSTDWPVGNQDTGASVTETESLTFTAWGSSTAAAAEPGSRAISGRDPVAAKDAGTGPHAIPSWGSRLDLTMVSPAEDVLELDYMEDEEDASEFLLSDSDEQEDDVFVSPAQAAKPGAMAALSAIAHQLRPVSVWTYKPCVSALRPD
ncbi:hypothetical protein CesoFtcFv8_015208 [Champsocephalus esox]|uniref:Uncharacterized protein n=1 Tax=Champsocephalus esox TaxID=159716 RepID=A0AAN8BQ85_9TELE|nr:hypothetical protein CesoFtcFv8_015208 [Champsocephalus esox]